VKLALARETEITVTGVFHSGLRAVRVKLKTSAIAKSRLQ
jgi:hypothetical protein